jgi:dihydrofolate synthase / folylpolyglutamate synthase
LYRIPVPLSYIIIMDFEGAVKYLKGYLNCADFAFTQYVLKTFDLERIRDFLRKMGVDYNSLKFVHVAGSKGKGSTSKMIADYLFAKGYKTGLYTSPPMFEVTECFWLDGKDIEKERFAKMVENLKKFIDENGCELTYFELMTVLSFQYFVEEEVDYVVLEVGLGGRLDATNVVTPQISVITTVEKEHSEILGDNLSDILDEKLGIVKEGIPTIVGFQSEEGMSLAKEKLCDKDFVTYVEEEDTPLLGSVNVAKIKNGKTAYLALKTMLKEVDENLFVRIFDEFKLLGRFDIRYIDGKTVVFDMAHTENSIENLIDGLKRLYKGKKFVFLVSILKGKEISAILRLIGKSAEKVVLTSSHIERGYTGKELSEFIDGEVIENTEEAYQKILRELKRDQVMVVTGSHFLLSKIMPR